MNSQLKLDFIEDSFNALHTISIRSREFDSLLAESRTIHEKINYYLINHPEDRPKVMNPKSAYEIVKPFLENLDHEELWVLVLDQRNNVVRIVALYRGSVNLTQVRIGEVFRVAIIETAKSIVLFHNHPSGDPTPSPDDVGITRAIADAGKLLDIDLLDHIIVGSAGAYVSLKERGLLS
jgi:DNA repair protein RadC